MKYWLAAVVLGAAAIAGCARRPPSEAGPGAGIDLLRHAEEATFSTDYDGVMESHAVTPRGWVFIHVRAYFHKPGMTRLDYLSGPMSGLIVVQGPETGWRYDPVSRQVILTRGSIPKPAQRELLLEQNYQIVVTPHEHMAGREVLQLDLIPRHRGNSWQRFWVDAQTHVILGQAKFAGDGASESWSQFRTVTFKPEPDSLFSLTAAPVKTAPEEPSSMSLDTLQAKVGFPLALPQWLPQGYRLESNILTRCEDNCSPVALTRFTDGVADVTLFQSQHVVDSPECKIIAHGAQHEVRMVRNNTDYVVVGDLNPDVLQKIALSLPLSPAPKKP